MAHSGVRTDIMAAAKAVNSKKVLLTGKGGKANGKKLLKGGKPTPGGIGGKPSVGKKHGL